MYAIVSLFKIFIIYIINFRCNTTLQKLRATQITFKL